MVEEDNFLEVTLNLLKAVDLHKVEILMDPLTPRAAASQVVEELVVEVWSDRCNQG